MPLLHEIARAWLRSILLGALLGFPILGIGSRIAMRGIAVLSGTPGGFTWGGSTTVVFLGTAAGVAAGAIHQLLATLLPRRPGVRDVLFVVVITLLTLRGLRPISRNPLLLLGATMAVFVIAFLVAVRRSAVDDALFSRPLP